MKRRIGIGAVIVLAVVGQAAQAAAEEIKLFSSNGIRAVLEELIPRFERQSGHRVIVSWSQAAALKKLIDSGERFDVAILTPEMIDDLMRRGTVAAGSKEVLARSGMALAIRFGSPKPDIRTTEAVRRALTEATSIAFAEQAMGGIYFRGLLQKLSLQGQLDSRFKLVASGTESAAMVARGEAQLAVLPMSEILPVRGIEALGPFPADVQEYLVMSAGISSRAAGATAARAFIDFVMSPAAVPVLESKGMERP